MTERPGQQPAGGSPTHGRHHRNPPGGRTRAITILGLVVAIVGAAGLATWLLRSGDSGESTAGSATSATSSGTGPATGVGSAGGSSTAGSPVASAGQTGATAGAQCPLTGGSLTIAAAPDIAEAVMELTDPQGGCPVTVTPVDPAAFAAGDRTGADIWIPDSSMWVATAAAGGFAPPASSPSVATSPLVLAIPPGTAARLAQAGGTTDVAAILASRKTA